MSDEADGDARVVDDSDTAGCHLARVQPMHGTLAGIAADDFRVRQVGPVDLALAVIVALHPRAGAGNRRSAEAEARTEIGAGEAAGGGQHQAAQSPVGAGAAGIGDAGHGTGGILGGQRGFGELVGRGNGGVEQIEVGEAGGERLRLGQSRETILGRDLGHGDGALGEFRRIGQHIGGNGRRAPADEGTQREIVALGAAGLLDLAETHVDRQRYAAHADRIGRIGPRFARRGNQALGALGQVGLVEYLGHEFPSHRLAA